MSVRLSETTPLVEAAPSAPKSRRFRARLIEAGVQGSSGFYPAETLKNSAAAFPRDTQVFIDHPSLTEAADRPERSVKDLAGRLATDAVFDGDGLYAEVEVFPHYAPLIEGAYDAIGMSIRALGTCEPSQDDSIRGPIVTALTEGISVDFVTKAGAGGKVLELIESARAHADGELWEAKYDAAQLKAMLGKGQAMKNADGEPSYPIADEQDLRNAIRAVGRGGADHDKIRAHIIRRAKALGKSDLIPADWTNKAPAKAKESAEPPSREELREAGATIGARIEARTHTAFTILADDMYCDGRLTRAERLILSSALGDALGTLVARLEKDAPQLYQRGPWSYPPDDDGADEPMVEAAKKPPFPPFGKKDDDPEDTGGDAGKTDPADGEGEDDPKAKKAKDAPGSKPAPKKMKEGAMPEITEEQAAQLAEAAQTKTRLDEAIGKLDQATQLIETQGAKIETLEAALAEAGKRDQVRDNTARARTLCEAALATSGLPTQAHPRVLREATATLPTSDDGALDETKLDEAIKAAIQGEKTYLAELDEARGYGFPRGLTSDPTPAGESDGDLDKALVESLEDIGMTADEAKIAASGR